MTPFEQIIDQLSKAVAPDARLDQAIAAFLGNDPQDPVPRWTSSIDAAVTLIEGQPGFQVNNHENGRASAFVGQQCYVEAAAPAIALCISALYRIVGKEPVNLNHMPS